MKSLPLLGALFPKASATWAVWNKEGQAWEVESIAGTKRDRTVIMAYSLQSTHSAPDPTPSLRHTPCAGCCNCPHLVSEGAVAQREGKQDLNSGLYSLKAQVL